jgi:formylglycine-generating enzyme required for sulfatase activity
MQVVSFAPLGRLLGDVLLGIWAGKCVGVRAENREMPFRRLWLLLALGSLQLCSANFASAQIHEDMVELPGGVYPLGSDRHGPQARPAHKVDFKPFAIDRFEVTNAEYAAFLATLNVRPIRDVAAGKLTRQDVEGADAGLLFTASGDARHLIELDDADVWLIALGGRFVPQPGFERHPVREVTWEGSRRFCAWRGARLPTEAEWEAAARGRDGRLAPWGDSPATPERVSMNRRHEPIGSYPKGATPEGIHDLIGSLAEWTSTLYRPYPYSGVDGREDGTIQGERVTRGGDYSWDNSPDRLNAIFRTGSSRNPTAGHHHIGFRCARSR